MSECVKIGDSLVCLPDDDEQVGEKLEELFGSVTDILAYADDLEEQRTDTEHVLIDVTNKLLSLTKDLIYVRRVERKLKFACDKMRENLEVIVEWHREQREETGKREQKMEEAKDIRNQFLVSLREAFKMLCVPNKRIPYLLVGIGTAEDGVKKVWTVLSNINGNPWQDSDVKFLGTVNLSELKPGDSDRMLAEYEKKINEYVDSLYVE